MKFVLKLLHLWRLLNWRGTRKCKSWCVKLFNDNMWYVQEEHRDHGWIVHPDSASKLRRDAVAWAHRYYAKPTR